MAPLGDCSICIYDHIYIEVALGQKCQMYDKPAVQGGGLPYNISSSERLDKIQTHKCVGVDASCEFLQNTSCGDRYYGQH